MGVHITQINYTTDESGDFTTDVEVQGERFLQWRHVYGDSDTGADIDITGKVTGYVYLNQDDLGTSSLSRSPRVATSDETGAASLYAGSGEPVEDYAFIGGEKLTVTIANGGDSKFGAIYIWTG